MAFQTGIYFALKTEQDYRDIVDLMEVDPAELIMVGDSVKSDGVPVLAMGGSSLLVARKDMEGMKRIFERADAGENSKLRIVSDLTAVADMITDELHITTKSQSPTVVENLSPFRPMR